MYNKQISKEVPDWTRQHMDWYDKAIGRNFGFPENINDTFDKQLQRWANSGPRHDAETKDHLLNWGVAAPFKDPDGGYCSSKLLSKVGPIRSKTDEARTRLAYQMDPWAGMREEWEKKRKGIDDHSKMRQFFRETGDRFLQDYYKINKMDKPDKSKEKVTEAIEDVVAEANTIRALQEKQAQYFQDLKAKEQEREEQSKRVVDADQLIRDASQNMQIEL